MRNVAKFTAWLLFLLMVQGAHAQVQVGDDLRMNAGGLITAGYAANYGDQVQSSHGLDLGANGQLNGSYFNPNFLSFSITPYYNQSRANSNFRSLTNSSGVEADANLFSGSRFPGYVSYHYAHDSNGTFGLIGTPNFTTVGDGHGFGIGWSALIPDWPTLSVSYSEGSGTGTVFGTNDLASSDTHTVNVRSTYRFAGWQLNAYYNHLNLSSKFPIFLGGQEAKNSNNFNGNDFGINGSHDLHLKGTVSVSYNHATYGGNTASTFEQSLSNSNYTTDNETDIVTLHPTQK